MARELYLAVMQSMMVCDIGGRVTVSNENREMDATISGIGSVSNDMRLGSVPNMTRFLHTLRSIRVR